MKKIFVAFGLLCVALVIGLSIAGSPVREIKTEIQLTATPEQVWNVLTNINQWKDWNTTINSTEGAATVGSVLDITIRGDDGKDASNYQPVVIESKSPQIFRWRAHMLSEYVFKNDRIFILESRDGGTFLIHKEEFSGMMVPLMWGMLKDFVGPTLEKMNQDLQNYTNQ